MFRGSVRVPVPVLLAALLVLAAIVFYKRPAQPQLAQPKPPSSVTLADFEPVKQLQPQIIRSENERR